jgi:putative drug exporter of the RND superfamily
VRGSFFTFAAGRRSKWIVFGIWFVAIFIASSANLPGKFEDAESNEATSYLPGSAESTHALHATESLQKGEIAPAVIVFRRESGLTATDSRTIVEDVGKMTAKRFPGVVPDGATAAAGGKPQASKGGSPPIAEGLKAGCGSPTTTVPGQPADYAPFVGPICS